MLKIFTAILFFLICFGVSAQYNENDNQLANQYFNNKEFDKASVYYKKLFDETKTKVYLDFYVKCLIELKDFEIAEKVLKKEIKRNPSTVNLYVELGFLYKIQGNLQDATEQYDKAIKKMSYDQNQIVGLANSFIIKQEYEYAEKTYTEGAKQMRGFYNFNLELASVYLLQRNYQKMVNEYLDVLENQPTFLEQIQNLLQQYIFSELDSNQNVLLKQNILKRVRKSPEKIVFSELLIWLYIQERDFANAVLQAKALDKRNKEDGDRLIEIGNLATTNQYYDEAISAYKYVIDKGEDYPFYVEAQNQYLNTLYKKIIDDSTNVKKNIIELENIYITTLNKLGENKYTLLIVENLSHIQTFYLDKGKEASERLIKMLENKNLTKDEISGCKLELADILLFMGNVWEATLYYAQVQFSNENSPIGYEAKYRIAKIAYYTGDFKWAQAQLSVLKASTSKLIANDAFQISFLISENTLEDTSGEALKMLGKAEYLVFQNKDSIALLILDTINNKFAYNSILPDVLYEKAEIMKKAGNFVKASEFLEGIIKSYSNSILVDDALFDLAELYEKKLNNKDKAKELYNELFTKYPGSIYSAEARARYRLLRGDKLIN